MILPYSAMKISANPSLPYSILNPDTSSDSPSAKSKGVRLVSAMHETSQTPVIGAKIKIFDHTAFVAEQLNMLNLPTRAKKNIKIMASLTS